MRQVLRFARFRPDGLRLQEAAAIASLVNYPAVALVGRHALTCPELFRASDTFGKRVERYGTAAEVVSGCPLHLVHHVTAQANTTVLLEDEERRDCTG